jgi:hypothetical protein
MWQCVRQAEPVVFEPLQNSYESRIHGELVANRSTRIAVHTDQLAPQGFQSAFKVLPVLVDDVPVQDGSRLIFTVCVSRCGHLDRDFTRNFRNQRAFALDSSSCSSYLWLQLG